MNKKALFISLVLIVSFSTTIASLLGCGDLGSALFFVFILNTITIIILGTGDRLWKHNTISEL